MKEYISVVLSHPVCYWPRKLIQYGSHQYFSALDLPPSCHFLPLNSSCHLSSYHHILGLEVRRGQETGNHPNFPIQWCGGPRWYWLTWANDIFLPKSMFNDITWVPWNPATSEGIYTMEIGKQTLQIRAFFTRELIAKHLPVHHCPNCVSTTFPTLFIAPFCPIPARGWGGVRKMTLMLL